MTSARFIVGDTRAVTATLPDQSVDFLMTSPPFLALRSYLPADHPDKALEIGSEATPAAFIDVLLELSAEWRRVLAPHGSIVVELGDTYAGSGGSAEPHPAHRAVNETLEVGFSLEDGSASDNVIRPSLIRRTDHVPTVTTNRGGRITTSADIAGRGENIGGHHMGGKGWPRNKSLTLIPEAYRFALVYGVNPHTGQASPAGRWQARNVIRWVRPNPPVGALGKKWRPATSELVVACPDDDRRYWDDVATRVEPSRPRLGTTRHKVRDDADPSALRGSLTGEFEINNPAGAPLLDWWKITPTGYPGAHYAVYPPELCEAPIEAMCPRRVCLTCGEPSRRETESDPTPVLESQRTLNRLTGSRGLGAGTERPNANPTTTGWTTCGCPGTDGIRLDGYHTGGGWRPGVVFDPFAGTGTTLSVATGHGRDAIGIDLDPRNADLAIERVGPLMLTVERHAREIVA